RRSQSRRSVGVETLVGMVVAMSALLRLVLVKSTRERAGPPSVVGDGEAVLRWKLYPDALLAAQLRRGVRAGAELGPVHLDDAVVLHHRNSMRQEEGLALIVGDIDRRDTEPPLQLAQLDAHALPQLRVEIRERLVQQEQLRLAHERARQREPLLLAAGELRRGAFTEALQPDESKRLRDHPPRLSPRRGLRAHA